MNEQEDVFVWNLNKNGSFSAQYFYKDIMKSEGLPRKYIFWRVKLPLKIKIFLWYLKKGVMLTKDNLVKRRWRQSTKCCCCGPEETIQHLLFNCHIARSVRNGVFIDFSIQPPSRVDHIFGYWLAIYSSKLKSQILIGIAALCWAMWLCINDAIFNRATSHSFFQVIFRAMYWIRQWSLLCKEEESITLKEGCNLLEALVLEVFNKFAWVNRNRVET